MINTYLYDTDSDEIRILQITDPHLFKDTSGELLGINTYASFKQVITEIQASPFRADFILATGDLVQDSSDEGYLRFCEMVKPLKKPVFWLPGNHDFQPKMHEFLNREHGNISAKKQVMAGDKWQVLLLDSQVFGVPHGSLTEYQLDWLHDKLKADEERYALIVLHHHLLSTHSAWLDQHNLRNANELARILSMFKNVKGIVYGHIHQAVDGFWNGYQVMSTPSTCIQFKPDTNHFALDTLQPGWREIILHSDGRIETYVRRIQQASFLPSLSEDGY